jgi:diacylglycerol kinase family enzyme
VTTGPGVLPRASRRLAAWVALAALAAVIVESAWFVVVSRGLVLAVGLAVGAGVALLGAAGWWAFTTSRRWKRRLYVTLAGCVIAILLVGIAVFSTAYATATLGTAALAVAYLAASGWALRPAVPTVPGQHPARPKAPWLLVNPRSGDGKAERIGLAEAARARGISVRLLLPGEDAVALTRAAVAAGADAVGMAGGDGSLARVAQAAIERGVPFVCVPAGTRNNFAHDLGLDRGNPLAALDAFAGRERRIDVGMVGDRPFLNNVSLGAYADLVHWPGYRAAKLGTAHTVLRPTLRGEAPPVEMSFQDPAGRRHDGALVLLVANNAYDVRFPFGLGTRARLDANVLQVSALAAGTGARLGSVLVRVATSRVVTAAGWSQWTSTGFRVDASAGRLPAGIDGEATVLVPPLEFRVLPRALRVLVPDGPRPARRHLLRAFHGHTIRSLWRLARRGGSRGVAAAREPDP